MADVKKLGEAFQHLADYDGDVYKTLNDTSQSVLLALSYRFKSSRIILIGTQHMYRNKERSSRIINEIVARFDLYLKYTSRAKRLVMVEGFDVEPVCMDTLQESFERGGEPMGVAFLAKNTKTEVISPEPKMKEMIKELLFMGFSKYQIMLHFVVRQIPQLIGAKMINERGLLYLQKLAELMADKKEGYLNLDYIINTIIPRLNQVMKDINGKDLFRIENHLIYSNFAKEELWSLTNPTLPVVDKIKSTIINEIAYHTNNIRDGNILKELWLAVKVGKSPFLVYGRSHIARIKPALDYLYGKPLEISHIVG